MKTMQWLIRRELWEHKGMLVWTPAVVSGLIALLVSGALLLGHNVMIVGDGPPVHFDHMTMTDSVQHTVAQTLSQWYVSACAPLLAMLGFLVFFYCLGALHDERRDRSLLFWKSLPVSDRMTVLSKAALALIVAPVITIGLGIVLSLLTLLLVTFSLNVHGIHLFGSVLSSPDFYLAPLRVFGLVPVYALWALPTVGWLLLVSSWARSKVFLWAVGVPLMTGVLLKLINAVFGFGWDSAWFMHTIVSRLLLGVLPGSWLASGAVDPRTLMSEGMHRVDPGKVFEVSWATLGTPNLWAGVAAGVAMIAAAVWMRRWREEG